MSSLCTYTHVWICPLPNDQGMSLSGGEVRASQERIIAGLKEKYPQTSKSYLVCTDTFGSIATAFPGGENR